MTIEEKFEDFSYLPEHLRPVKLDKIPLSPEDILDTIYSILAQEGSAVTTAALQNTLKVYGIEGATSVMAGEYEKTARIVQFLREQGIHELSRTQAAILVYNTVSKHIDDPDSFSLASMPFVDRDFVTPRVLYEALSVPEKRYLNRGIDRYKLPDLCQALKSAPDHLKTGELQNKFALTRLSTAPCRRRRDPHYIEAPRYS